MDELLRIYRGIVVRDTRDPKRATLVHIYIIIISKLAKRLSFFVNVEIMSSSLKFVQNIVEFIHLGKIENKSRVHYP